MVLGTIILTLDPFPHTITDLAKRCHNLPPHLLPIHLTHNTTESFARPLSCGLTWGSPHKTSLRIRAFPGFDRSSKPQHCKRLAFVPTPRLEIPNHGFTILKGFTVLKKVTISLDSIRTMWNRSSYRPTLVEFSTSFGRRNDCG